MSRPWSTEQERLRQVFGALPDPRTDYRPLHEQLEERSQITAALLRREEKPDHD